MPILSFWDETVPMRGTLVGRLYQKGTVTALVELYNASVTGCSLDIFCSGEAVSLLGNEVIHDESVSIVASEEGREI